MRLRQLRAFRLDDVQAGDAGHVTFHSSVFGVKDTYDTIFDRGCFAQTISHHGGMFDVMWFHDPRTPLGDGVHSEDETGLRVDATLDLNVEKAREVYSGLKLGYINCGSIAFDSITETKGEDDVLHFKEVALFESSLLPRHYASNALALVKEVRAINPGIDYLDPPIVAISEADLRRTIEAFTTLRERELTDSEAALLAECSIALQALLTPGQGRPYPNEHACRLHDPDLYDHWGRVEREHEGKKYSVIRGQLKSSDKWEDQAFRYPKATWEAAEARTHCKAHDGSFEAASGADAIACALNDTHTEPPTIVLPAALLKDARDLAAALASRGAIRSPSGSRRTPSIAADLHALLTDVKALGHSLGQGQRR